MAWKIKSLLLVRLCISLALVFSLAVIPVVAQTDLHVTGKVIDGSGIEVIGASVVVKGTTNGSVTGVDGTSQFLFLVKNLFSKFHLLVMKAKK